MLEKRLRQHESLIELWLEHIFTSQPAHADYLFGQLHDVYKDDVEMLQRVSQAQRNYITHVSYGDGVYRR